MCNTAILPTILKSDQVGSDIVSITYIFNRWLKMLASYGKLDRSSFDKDLSVISRVLSSNEICPKNKEAIKICRDYAISNSNGCDAFIYRLKVALKLLCKSQDSFSIKKIAKRYADQGMTERYRPLTKRLAKEKIHKINHEITFTNQYIDDKKTTKLVRRFVEKRAAQTVHKNSAKKDKTTNRYRQSVRRATSFALYNKRYADYDARLRATKTHWKVVTHFSKGIKVLEAKCSYNTYEEAIEACNRFALRNPDDNRPMGVYRCGYCDKWHIGHIQNSRLQVVQNDLGCQEAS